MLVHVRENASRTEKVVNLQTSNGGDAIASSVFMDMLSSGEFAAELEQWHRAQGLITVPVGNTSNAINRSAPPAIDTAAAPADVSPAADESDSDDDSDNNESAAALPALPVLQNNTHIPFNNSQDVFDLVD